jgi:SAM-dependent methyltransferase
MTAERSAGAKWPKRLAPMTAEQLRIRDEWMKIWLEQHMTKATYVTLLERFNQRYPLKTARPGQRTLEIGAGVGAHCEWEDLATQEYHCNELRPELVEELRRKHPGVHAALGDCQEGLDFPDAHFDRVIAIHVLEHLPNLPKALREIRRVLKPGGRFSVVIPCEGGLAYSLARQLSAKRIFEKRFQQSYDWLIASEHVNQAHEVVEELGHVFGVEERSFYPLRVASTDINLLIGLTLA